MRIIVFTGKGGVGKTSVAAATALAVAERGARTLVMSTDPAHSLSDAFGADIGGDPTEVAPKLFGLQIDAQQRLEQHWDAIQDYVTKLLAWAGSDPLTAEEITVLPGFDEVFSLTDLRRFHDEGSFDCIVVDCAPTAETMRLLSLPDIARWYMERIFPMERRVAKVVRPVLRRVTSIPAPSDPVFDATERLYKSLEGVGRILTDKRTSTIRLVMNPEKMVIAEAQRMFTYLSLFGYRVDAVVVNRLLPEAVTDPYFATWKTIHAAHLQTIRESFDPLPILTARLFDMEMVGLDRLRDFGREVYGDRDAKAILHRDEPMRVEKDGETYVLSLRLPLVEGRLDLKRRGEELILTVGAYRHTVMLPQALRRRDVIEADLSEGELRIRFGKGGSGE